LEGDPGLLQQVGLDVAAGQLASYVEVDPDKLALNQSDVYKNEARAKYFKLLNSDCSRS
jgi:hypothetical protein